LNNENLSNVQIHGGVVIKITAIEHYYQAISFETEIRTPIMKGKEIDYLINFMSTSANVVEYRIVNKVTGKEVGHHRQHMMCKTNWETLLQYHPLEDHTIQAYGYDEEEEEWEGEVEPLFDFLVGVGEIQLK